MQKVVDFRQVEIREEVLRLRSKQLLKRNKSMEDVSKRIFADDASLDQLKEAGLIDGIGTIDEILSKRKEFDHKTKRTIMNINSNFAFRGLK